jgi:lysozyme
MSAVQDRQPVVSATGLALIKRFEGFRAHAYRDPVGILTIGYGHTSMAGPPEVRPGLTITEAEAGEILARDVERFADAVTCEVKIALTDDQFSALVSFAYNVGPENFRKSSVLRAVNARDFDAVPRRLALWVKAGGRTLPGLITRRAAEGELFAKVNGATDAEETSIPEPPAPGKKPWASTTNWAALIAALASVLAGLGNRELAWIIALAGIAAAAWIVKERLSKAQEDGL